MAGGAPTMQWGVPRWLPVAQDFLSSRPAGEHGSAGLRSGDACCAHRLHGQDPRTLWSSKWAGGSLVTPSRCRAGSPAQGGGPGGRAVRVAPWLWESGGAQQEGHSLRASSKLECVRPGQGAELQPQPRWASCPGATGPWVSVDVGLVAPPGTLGHGTVSWTAPPQMPMCQGESHPLSSPCPGLPSQPATVSSALMPALVLLPDAP